MMPKWVIVPCSNTECRRDTFLARRDENNLVAEIYCAACKNVIARFEAVMAPDPGIGSVTGSSGPRS